jgi:MFS family permease
LAGETAYKQKGKTDPDPEDYIDMIVRSCQVMILFGVGQIIGSWVSGQIGKKFGKRLTLKWNLGLSAFSVIIALIVTSASRVK